MLLKNTWKQIDSADVQNSISAQNHHFYNDRDQNYTPHHVYSPSHKACLCRQIYNWHEFVMFTRRQGYNQAVQTHRRIITINHNVGELTLHVKTKQIKFSYRNGRSVFSWIVYLSVEIVWANIYLLYTIMLKGLLRYICAYFP